MSDTSTTTSAQRRKRVSKAARASAIIPLALLSAAWTASLTGIGVANPLAAATHYPTLPDGSRIPTKAIKAPANVSSPTAGSPKYRGKGDQAEQIVANSSANGIPAAALAAYQRAETVIDQADPSCHLSWQLLAAIGRVESNHGQFGGSVLSTSGLATPAIYGPKLAMADTDGGSLDDATGYDRAVGPMQFIPSTWAAVAVDGDNDGKRDPQDINDAALGAAVYLCSGDGDLSTTAGQRAAVFRYNHSTSYVDLVLAIMNAYLDGDFISTPDDTIAGGYLAPLAPGSTQGSGKPDKPRHTPTNHTGDVAQQPDAPTSTPPNSTPISPSPSPTKPSPTPTKPTPSLPGVPGLPTVTLPTLPSTGASPVDQLLTTTQAILQCTLDGYVDNLLSTNDDFDQCVTSYTTTGHGPKGDHS